MDKKIRYEIEEVLSTIRPFTKRKDSRVNFDGDLVPHEFKLLLNVCY